MLSKVALLFTVLTLVAADFENVTSTTALTPASTSAPANITTTAVPLNVTEPTTPSAVTTTAAVATSPASPNTTTSQAATTTPASPTTTVATSTTTGRPDGSTWFVDGYLCKLTLFKQFNIRYTSCSDKKSNDTSVVPSKGEN